MTDTQTPLGIGVEADSRPAFLYDNDLGVDVNDPIYQQVAAALENDPRNAPIPGTAPRPPEMRVGENGEMIVVPAPLPTEVPATPAVPPVIPEIPVVEGVQVPAPDTGAPSSTVPPAGAAPSPAGDPPSSEIEINFAGQDYKLGQDEVTFLLQQNAWMQQVPEQTRQQWAGIENGSMVAVSREELAALQAAAQAPAPAAPAAPVVPDLTYVDEDVQAYIRTLQASQSAPAPTQQSPAPSTDVGPSPFQIQEAANQEAERQVRIRSQITEATTAFTTDYGLTAEQANRLQQVTVNLGVVASLARERSVYSPTGALIAEAPMGEVMKQAYEVAMNADPELRQLRDERVFNERLAAQSSANAAVNQKKALAGSLASAPSAAVPANTGAALTIGPGNQMNLGATAEAMAAYIAEQQASGAGA